MTQTNRIQPRDTLASPAGAQMTSCSWLAQNFSEDYLLDPILAGYTRHTAAARAWSSR
jgi:hypothetical protein